MPDTSITDETVKAGDTQTTVTTSAPDKGNAVDPAEVERLRQEAEKANIRVRQLENEAEARKKADVDAEAKRLEEKEEYKALYEKNDAELKQIREDREQAERQTALSTATDEVFKDFPTEVVEVAKTAGITLSDDSEAARTALTEKLNSIKEKVAPAVTANNPYTPPTADDRSALLVKAEDGSTPMALAGAKGDPSVANKYIGGLSAIKIMKKQAGVSVE